MCILPKINVGKNFGFGFKLVFFLSKQINFYHRNVFSLDSKFKTRYLFIKYLMLFFLNKQIFLVLLTTI